MVSRKKESFETRLAALEELITRMENGGLSLEDSMRYYETGLRTIHALEKEVDAAQQRLTVLRRSSEGTLVEEPLEDMQE